MSSFSTSSGVNYNHLVPKLDGTNYATWKMKMEMLLIRERLWSIVSGARVSPAVPQAASPASRAASPAATDTIAGEASIKWEEDRDRAMATIVLLIDERVVKEIKTLRDPVQIWKKHENAVDRYIDILRSCCQQLRDSGTDVPNEIEASVLLSGLDPSYESFVASTTQSFRLSASTTDIDVDNLIYQLHDEDRRRKTNTPYVLGDSNLMGTQQPLSALVAHARTFKRQRTDTEFSQSRVCNRSGHVQNNCWDLHPDKKQKERYAASMPVCEYVEAL